MFSCISLVAQKDLSNYDLLLKIEGASKDPLVGANVSLLSLKKVFYTDEKGKLKLNLPKGVYPIEISFVGYASFHDTLQIPEITKRQYQLSLTNKEIEAIEVKGKKKAIVESSSNLTRLDAATIKAAPRLLGEADPLKLVQLNSGVQLNHETEQGYHVRGGAADQNLILYNGATIYNANHLAGFFSVFNGDNISSVDFYKGYTPASKGARLSSVMEVQTKRPSLRKWNSNIGIGLVASNGNFNGPVIKDTLGINIHFRQTAIESILKPLLRTRLDESWLDNNNYQFNDYGADVLWKVNSKNDIQFTYFKGGDQFDFSDADLAIQNSLGWNNELFILNWQQRRSKNIINEWHFSSSSYKFNLDGSQYGFKIDIQSRIQDWKLAFLQKDYSVDKHTFNYGFSIIKHDFLPYNKYAEVDSFTFNFGDEDHFYGNEAAFFIDDVFEVRKGLVINYGLRYTFYEHVGEYQQVLKDGIGQPIDTTIVPKGDVAQYYYHLQPRVSVLIDIRKNRQVKISASKQNQYTHLASVSAISLPVDFWFPSTVLLKPQESKQVSIGYYLKLDRERISFHIEGYQKWMNNIVDFEHGIFGSYFQSNADDQLLQGRGVSKGVEFALAKLKGKTLGQINYTLSHTENQFDEINGGEWFDAKYDRRHNMNINIQQTINDRLSINSVFVYASGQAVTIPTGRYIIQGHIINEYGGKNNYRLAPYHRLDVGMSYKTSKSEKWDSRLIVSVFNLYNRKNPFYVLSQIEGNVRENYINVDTKEVALFGIMPSIKWELKF